jgi:hypothetical protein
MRDRDAVAAMIDRIIARARIPSRVRREDLRRELWTHFEDGSQAVDDDALRRFGPDAMVGDELRHVYRREYAFWYVARVAASVVASLAAALLIEVALNLRLHLPGGGWHLAPGFLRSSWLSVAVVLGLIAVWESARRPFSGARAAIAILVYAGVCLAARLLFSNIAGGLSTAATLIAIGWLCSRLDRWPARGSALVAAFAAVLYLNHAWLHVAFGPTRALVAGAILGAVWSSTAVIVHRVDRAFGRAIDSPSA